MADEYIAPTVDLDADQMAEDALAYLETAIPGFDPAAGSFVTHLLTAASRIMATAGEVASAGMTEAFAWLGESLHQIPRTRATPATVDATITVADDAGYTIPAGLMVQVEGPDGAVMFETQDELEITSPATSGVVTLIAQEDGAHTSGLPGPAQVAEVTDLPIESITLATVTTGGRDDETIDAYLIKLVAELGLLTRTPILPADFATRARHLAGGGRALALDLYDPVEDEWDVERTITVAIRDDTGEPYSSGVKATVQAGLAAARETNFRVFVIDPDYTEIDVDVEFVVYPGYDVGQVAQAVEDALATYLSPATWGQPPFGSADGRWHQLDTVRHQELSTVVNNVEGVSHHTTLTICEAGGTPGTADVTLAGAAPVARPGTITVAEAT